MLNEPVYISCLLCSGTGVCQECRGRGLVTCVFCVGFGCEDCEQTGSVACVPCDRSGECWRCEGRGYMKPPVGSSF